MYQTQDLLLIIEKKSNRGRKGPMELVWSNLQPRAGPKQKITRSWSYSFLVEDTISPKWEVPGKYLGKQFDQH